MKITAVHTITVVCDTVEIPDEYLDMIHECVGTQERRSTGWTAALMDLSARLRDPNMENVAIFTTVNVEGN